MGAVHGRLLTAWSAAGVAGPLIVNGLADWRPAAASRAPTSTRCRCYIMVGVLIVGFIANLMIRPVSDRHMERAAEEDTSTGRFRREHAPVTAERS